MADAELILAFEILHARMKEITERRNKFSPKKFTESQLQTLAWIHWALHHFRYRSADDFQLTSEKIGSDLGIDGVIPLMLGIIVVRLRKANVTSLRTLMNLLRKSSELRNALELKGVPHYSTISAAWTRSAKRQDTAAKSPSPDITGQSP